MKVIQHKFVWEDDESQQVFWEFRQRSPEEVSAEVDKIISLCRLPPQSRVLDVGCGTGLHAAEFGKRGFRVTGIDISDFAVEKAKEECNNLSTCTILKMRGAELPWVGEFDLVLGLEHVLGFMSLVELQIHLHKIWEAVALRGTLLLHIAGGTLEAWLSRYPVHKWEVQDGRYVLVDKQLTEDSIKKERTVIIDPSSDRIDEYLEEQRYYKSTEILLLLSESGAKNIKTLRDLDGNPSREDKEVYFFLAHK
jgi:SAM-dependent methyltransferase